MTPPCIMSISQLAILLECHSYMDRVTHGYELSIYDIQLIHLSLILMGALIE